MLKALLYLFVFLGILFTVQTLVLTAYIIIYGQPSFSLPAWWNVIIMVTYSLVTMVVFLFSRWFKPSRSYVQSRPWAVLVWSGVAALGAIIPSMSLQDLLPEWTGWAKDIADQTELQLSELMQLGPVGYLVIALLPPVVEEMVFRGAVLRSLLDWKPQRQWLMIALSALIFALIHINPAQMPHAFLIGLLLGWMYARTRSIVPGVVYHWVNNSAAYALYHLGQNPEHVSDLFGPTQTVVLLAVVFSFCILVPALFQLNQRMQTASHKRTMAALLLALFGIFQMSGQELRELHQYNDRNSNLEGHVTQIVQDHNGFIWLSTWNGLYRFDGYEFCRLRSLVGDGCSMTSDRIRDIWLSGKGDFFCRTDDGFFRFDINEYRFYDVNTDAELAECQAALSSQPMRGKKRDGELHYIDPQGLYWQVIHNVLYCKMRTESPVTVLPMEQPAMIGTLARDSHNRIWVTTKGDATVRLLNADGSELGYLSPTGTLSKSYISFGHPIYSVFETRNGHIWLGSKPDGLFRLTEKSEGHFTVEHIDKLQTASVYDMTEDKRGRLWVAMLGQGIACIEDTGAPHPVVIDSLPGYPEGEVCHRVRRVYITQDNILFATTTDGIVVAKMEDDVRQMQFKRHSRDFRRPASLCCNATMDMVQTPNGRIFVSTETDGICEITSPDLLADTLTFRQYNVDTGLLPTDMIMGMTLYGDEQIIVVGDHQIVNLNIRTNTYENMGHLFFRHAYHFSEVSPLLLNDGRWVIGTTENVLFLPQSQAHCSNYQPPLLLTAISIQNQPKKLSVENVDTLRLSPSERSLTIHFAALDYTDPQAIKYQFRLGSESSEWNNIGTDHSVTLLDLRPGTYLLSLRSTNADGQWTDNVRRLTIIVKPTFWETPWAMVLIVLLCLAVFAAVAYTWFYIRRIKRRQQESLEKYLRLVEQQAAMRKQHAQETITEKEHIGLAAETGDAELASTDDNGDEAFMKSVIAYVEQNFGNSEADVTQMAEACAVSRSVLQRRIKQATGLTPIEFLREARLNHARHLLESTQQTVSEVAYHCGFNDPKYFSRFFRHSTGMSPSEFKAQQHH